MSSSLEINQTFGALLLHVVLQWFLVRCGLMECPRLGNPNSSSMFVRSDSIEG